MSVYVRYMYILHSVYNYNRNQLKQFPFLHLKYYY